MGLSAATSLLPLVLELGLTIPKHRQIMPAPVYGIRVLGLQFNGAGMGNVGPYAQQVGVMINGDGGHVGSLSSGPTDTENLRVSGEA